VKAFRSSYCNRTCDPSDVDNKYDAIGDALRKIRRRVDASGKKPVFVTYWPDSPGKCPKYDPAVFAAYQRHRVRLNDEIIEVAAEHGDHVIDTGDMTGFGDDPANFYDCLHPSTQGYRKIADRILEDFDAWEPPEPGIEDVWRRDIWW
jgi:lysophospholipase L1-like esterase